MPECSLSPPLLLFPPFPRHNADSDVLPWEERCSEQYPTLSDDAAIFPSVGWDGISLGFYLGRGSKIATWGVKCRSGFR